MRDRLYSLIVGATALLAPLAVVNCGRSEAPAGAAASTAARDAPSAAPGRTPISYRDARAILDALHADLPQDLKEKTQPEIESAWPAWVARYNAEIRSRLDRGDEDSVINFWLYGTTFSTLPRATADEVSRLGNARAEDLLIRRLDDLVSALASPGTNERLQFARRAVERRGIDPATPEGQERARVFLVQTRARVIEENARYRRAAQSARQLPSAQSRLGAYATLYQDRGLSTDTSLAADFNLEKALEAMKANGSLARVRRVAIVGPGLDFTDKAEGYDFYPQQTIQPFAVIDSLIRLGFARAVDLRMTTFDLSPRVNQHLEAARRRAEQGSAYVLQLPIKRGGSRESAHPDFGRYWERFGDRIGDVVQAMAAPPSATDVHVRAVAVRPEVVRSIASHDLNIVLERLAPLPPDERFDLIVATNVLVYYDGFAQALALANIGEMLRPSAFFLTNYEVHPGPPMEPSPALATTVQRDAQPIGDTLFWYRRK